MRGNASCQLKCRRNDRVRHIAHKSVRFHCNIRRISDSAERLAHRVKIGLAKIRQSVRIGVKIIIMDVDEIYPSRKLPYHALGTLSDKRGVSDVKAQTDIKLAKRVRIPYKLGSIGADRLYESVALSSVSAVRVLDQKAYTLIPCDFIQMMI